MAVVHNTGLSQYLEYGTGAVAGTYAGRVTGGEIFGDPNAVWRGSVGGKYARGSGIASIGGTATIEIADATLISYFSRTSYTDPTMTALSFEGGLQGDNNADWLHTGCYMNTLEASISINDALTCTIGWVATDEAEGTWDAGPTQSATHFEWFEGACTLDAQTTFAMQSMTIRASNGLEALSNIETKSSNTKRLPQDFKIGAETVEASITMLAKPSCATTDMWAIHEDTLITGMGAVMAATSGGTTVTITLANMAGAAHRMPFESEDGLVLFALELSGEPNNASTLTIN